MAAYVIIDVEITDVPLYGQFMEQVTPTIENHGGKFVARGGALQVIEGDWTPRRIALLEFPSLEQTNAWLASPEYNALNDIRTKSSNINMVTVVGV